MTGLVILVIGVVILAYSYWHIAKQRNEAGVEVYSGFFSMLAHRGLSVVIGIVGAVVALVGLVLFVTGI
ncbi:MAG: hypothetical protein OZ923_12400 [Comamonadaceae bacterium]|nr:hypothetical protein [Burkholderiales bacterium]MEB2349398.1 hypothetical protein [Comamonadaceae bacterium]